jgi:hypothetical protein
MCDPLSIGLAALSTVGSIASSAAQASAAEDVQNKQNAANAAWVAYQENAQHQAQLAEDTARQHANDARMATLSKMTPENQQQMQATEAQRLNTTYQNTSAAGTTGRGDPGQNTASSSPYLLSGEQSGVSTASPGGANAVGSISAQVNQATAQARSRISALATANSYGGSFGGLGRVDPIMMQQGANQINLQNELRKQDMQLLGVEQQVQPLHYALGANYGMMGQIGGALAGIAGKAIGAGAAGGFGGGGFGGGGPYDTGMGFTSDVPPADLGTAANPLPGLTAADYGY